MNGMADIHLRLPHMVRRLFAIALLLLCWITVPGDAMAQGGPPKLPGTGGTASKPDTAADIDNLIKTLDDPAAREKLKQQLQLLLQAQQGGTGAPGAAADEQPAKPGFGAKLLAVVSHHVNAVSNALVNLVEVIADVPLRAQEAAAVLSDPARRGYWMDAAVDIFGVLGTAFVVA